MSLTEYKNTALATSTVFFNIIILATGHSELTTGYWVLATDFTSPHNSNSLPKLIYTPPRA